MFVSNERLGERPLDAPPPLDVTPELIVEVISDSDCQRVLDAKLADFQAIGVDEFWIIRPEDRTVAVLRSTENSWEQEVIYRESEILISATLPSLTVAVADIFTIR